MTTYNRATLKTFFETGDVPGGSDYANLIDSCLNVVETGTQAIAGPIQPTELDTARVSAGNVNITGTLTITGQASAKANLKAKTITVSGMSATNANLTSCIIQTMSALHTYQTEGSYSAPITIKASGTSLSTANLLSTARMTILTAVTDGSDTGLGLLSNQTGLQQYVVNDTATSANLWPCTGGQINALSSGAAFALAGHTQYTVLHIRASGYVVK